MSKHWTIVHIRNGEIVNKKAVRTLFAAVTDGKYMVELNSANKRSNLQNRYYWGLVVPLIQQGIKEMGTEISKDEVHEFLKAKFNVIELVNEGTGQVETIPQSTTRLNKEQFGEYIERIQRFSAEFLNIVIPDPGTQVEIFETAE